MVTISGDSAGHFVGEESYFTLKLANNSSEPWEVEYYIQLLDKEFIVTEIAHDTTSVPSGLEPHIDIPVVFDEGLDGPYGLSLYAPTLGAQSVRTIWIGEKSAISTGDWPSIASHPWLWHLIGDFTEDAALNTAEDFIMNSPTFTFDGIEDTLELVETLYPDIENAWQFVFTFESRQAGYGDRTGEMLAEVITPHEVSVAVEQGEIRTALMDNEWDMLEQEIIE